MRDRLRASSEAAPRRAATPVHRGEPPSPLASLQRLAGNQAVAESLGASRRTAPPVPVQRTIDTTGVAYSLGEVFTNAWGVIRASEAKLLKRLDDPSVYVSIQATIGLKPAGNTIYGLYDPATRTVIDVGASLSAAYDKLGQRPFLPAIVVQLKASKYEYHDYLDLARVLTHELAVHGAGLLDFTERIAARDESLTKQWASLVTGDGPLSERRQHDAVALGHAPAYTVLVAAVKEALVKKGNVRDAKHLINRYHDDVLDCQIVMAKRELGEEKYREHPIFREMSVPPELPIDDVPLDRIKLERNAARTEQRWVVTT